MSLSSFIIRCVCWSSSASVCVRFVIFSSYCFSLSQSLVVFFRESSSWNFMRSCISVNLLSMSRSLAITVFSWSVDVFSLVGSGISSVFLLLPGVVSIPIGGPPNGGNSSCAIFVYLILFCENVYILLFDVYYLLMGRG